MTTKHIEQVMAVAPAGLQLTPTLLLCLEKLEAAWNLETPTYELGYDPIGWNEECGMPGDISKFLSGDDPVLEYINHEEHALYVYVEDDPAWWLRFRQ